MRIVPVMDLQGGRVVHARGGDRTEYQPLDRLPGSPPEHGQPVDAKAADPLAVAGAFRQRFGLSHLYVADLDAIEGRRLDTRVLQRLHAEGFTSMVDAGVRQAEDADALLAAGVDVVIAGTETLAGPGELAGLLDRVGPERVMLSLDLWDGRLVQRAAEWPASPIEVAAIARSWHVRQILVLDLARVGAHGGTGTERLVSELRLMHPTAAYWVGGGVRSLGDLRWLAAQGIAGALVASAFHDGRLTPSDLAHLAANEERRDAP